MQHTYTDTAPNKPAVAAFLGNLTTKMHSKKQSTDYLPGAAESCARVRHMAFHKCQIQLSFPAFYTRLFLFLIF